MHEGVKIHPDYSFSNVPHTDILVIPSSPSSMKDDLENSELIEMYGIEMYKGKKQHTYDLALKFLEQNPDRKLRPSVILILDEERKPYKKYKTLDLMKKDSRHGVQLDILYSLPLGSYGADPAAIYTSAFTSRWSFSIAS